MDQVWWHIYTYLNKFQQVVSENLMDIAELL